MHEKFTPSLKNISISIIHKKREEREFTNHFYIAHSTIHIHIS